MLQTMSKESEYFARIEAERLKSLQEEQHQQMALEEKKRLQQLHFMHCPKCGTKMFEVDYQNVKIDRCSECHGIYLDAGELDQIIDLEKGALGKLFGVFKV